MQKLILSVLATVLLALPATAQSEKPRGYTNFPIIVTLQFHAFAMPFRDVLTNFSNVGIGLGTEVSYTGDARFVQQLSVVWYRNRAIGDGLLLYTQPVWRPAFGDHAYGEVKAGVGYLLASRPSATFKQVNGTWTTRGRSGKGMLVIPVGVAVGYSPSTMGTVVSPFVGYQFMVVTGYNQSVPIVPETLVQAGTRVHFN